MTHMLDWLQGHKPAASPRTHLLLAAVLWTVVGSALLLVGARWAFQSGSRFAQLLLGAAVVVGFLKSRWVMDRAARRIVDRIVVRGQGQCIGGFLSWRTWLLVAAMAGSGRLLRATSIPLILIGTLYAAVGTALLLGTRLLWRAWYSSGPNA